MVIHLFFAIFFVSKLSELYVGLSKELGESMSMQYA
jgi:hypothetical protein